LKKRVVVTVARSNRGELLLLVAMGELPAVVIIIFRNKIYYVRVRLNRQSRKKQANNTRAIAQKHIIFYIHPEASSLLTEKFVGNESFQLLF
jgi:hypothetical protein